MTAQKLLKAMGALALAQEHQPSFTYRTYKGWRIKLGL